MSNKDYDKTVRGETLKDETESALERFFEDEIQLMNKLLEIVSPEDLEVELWTPAELVKSDSIRAGFDHKETIDALKKAKVITKFTDLASKNAPEPHRFYEAVIDFDNLHKHAEDLHDEVESWKGEAYELEQQKKSLLKILRGIFKEYPNEKEVTLSEEILGGYNPSNPSGDPAGISLLSPDTNRPDIRYSFMRAMRELERAGHFVIKDVEINFYAKPKHTPSSVKRAIFAVEIIHEPEFYPPAHCEVTIELPKTTSSKDFQDTTTEPLKQISDKVDTENKKPEEIIEESEENITNKPRCVIEKSIGYLKFGRYGPKKKIGSAKSRPFLFLQAIIDPIDVFKSVDAVFTVIWRENDNTDRKLINPVTAKARKVEIIKNSCIKELQKGNKLNGKIGFKFNYSETQIKAVLIE